MNSGTEEGAKKTALTFSEINKNCMRKLLIGSIYRHFKKT